MLASGEGLFPGFDGQDIVCFDKFPQIVQLDFHYAAPLGVIGDQVFVADPPTNGFGRNHAEFGSLFYA